MAIGGNMAESKSSGFSRVVQKHSLRAKERVSFSFNSFLINFYYTIF
jgi:hypothetical protein